MAHTPGPWKRFEYALGSSRIYVEEPKRELIADVHKDPSEPSEIVTVYNKCDSDLLFYAPDLLAELKACEILFDDYAAEHRVKHGMTSEKYQRNRRMADLCRAAIDKAEGRV